MNPVEYDRLAAYEPWYWWYVAQREGLIAAVSALQLRDGARILDAGCGTAMTLRELASKNKLQTFGIDVSPLAAQFWRHVDACASATRNSTPQRVGSEKASGILRESIVPPGDCEEQAAMTTSSAPKLSLASILDLPFPDDAFDAVFSVDCIGSRGVDAQRALRQMARVLRPGGHLIVLAPAYSWMRSAHDIAVHSVRRFRRRQIVDWLRPLGMSIVQSTHRFAALFPIVAAVRLWKRVFPGPTPKSDLAPLPDWLNALLLRIARIEHRWTKRSGAPFGSSILVIARKCDHV